MEFAKDEYMKKRARDSDPPRARSRSSDRAASPADGFSFTVMKLLLSCSLRPPTRPAACRFVAQVTPRTSMSGLPPVRKDRIITELPRCFTKEAALHTNESFHNKVKTACQDERTGGAGFAVCKVIVMGDVAVGKTCLINRFCRDTFDRSYKATIGVDFEMERFEVLGVPFSLQLWDTAGQERFKCIASTYYRGAQAMIIVFDVNNASSLLRVRQWLDDAMKENDPSSMLLFLVGTKKDLRVRAFAVILSRSSGSPVQTGVLPQSADQVSEIEQEAIRLAEEIRAEYWAVSALSGQSVKEFFFRVASLTFEAAVLAELERNESRPASDIVRITNDSSSPGAKRKSRRSSCCQ
ncbi:ras-related protein Rab-34 isoform X2 [Arapaima gigas]